MLLLLFAVFVVVWFSNLEYRKLVLTDEGRYAEIPREMVASGDWLTPRLNGIKYFEKPPLQYWVTATAYGVFGEHHWTARLWPALSGLLGVLLVYYGGRRLFGPAAGFFSALALGGSAGYIAVGHLNALDMGLTFFMTGALIAFLLGQRDGASAESRRRWVLCAWACAAFAVLSKGLIGIVLPAATLAIYVLLERDYGLLRRLHWGSGVTIFMAIAAPWFVLVQLANPEFARFFFIHEHFERFLTTVHRRVEPWWFFFPILAVGMLPWVTLLPQALLRGWRSVDRHDSFKPQRFLVIWALCIFTFYSLSNSKLPSYILPIFPALALLVGLWLAQAQARSLFWHLLVVLLLGVALTAFAPQVVRLASAKVPQALYEGYVPWLIASGLAAVMGGGYALYCCRRAKPGLALIATGLGSLFATQLVITGHDALSPAYSAYHFAQKVQPYLAADLPFYSVGTYEQTLPFYIKRTVTLVAFSGEMSYGLEQEPWLSIPDLASFEREWRGEGRALAIMEPHTYLALGQRGLPMQVVARDTRRLIVRKPDTSRQPNSPSRTGSEEK